MSEGDYLLAAVLDRPEDDAVRLVYADWLEERGALDDADRAEFVRVQIELDDFLPRGDGRCSCCGCPPGELHAGSCRRAALLMREEALLDAGPAALPNRLAWRWHVHPDISCEFRRGFVASVSLTLADFLEHAAALFKAHPVESVALSDKQPYASPLYEERGWFKHGWCDSENDLPATSHIGRRLFALLPDEGLATGGLAPGPHFKFYVTAEAARDALSAACVAFGRSLRK